MVTGDFTVNEQNFKENFNRSFNSFCEKAPLILNYKIVGDQVIIQDESGLMRDEYIYQLEYLKDKKANIADIKDYLMQYYPVFYDFVKEEYTAEEIKQMIDSEGISYREAMELQKKRMVKRYTIIRVINSHNELNVIDHKDKGKTKYFRLKYPVIKLMEVLFNNVSEAYDLFKEYAEEIRPNGRR